MFLTDWPEMIMDDYHSAVIDCGCLSKKMKTSTNAQQLPVLDEGWSLLQQNDQKMTFID